MWISATNRTFAGMLIALFSLGEAWADEPLFRLHSLDRDSVHNACAVMDVNRDGRLDVISGRWWYEAPHWQRHFVRDVEMIRGRYDDYAHLPMDVNGDGWLDLVSANYRSQSIYWAEHPGPSLGTWQTHVIDRPGAMETGRLADIDGDGQLDLLPNGLRFAAWWEHIFEGGHSHWVRHDLPAEIAGHGIGFGDLDGDGRGDIVGPGGWLAAPADPRRGRWQFRPDFTLDRDCSIPILVHDVDGDGDQDIMWGRGHRIGVYWLEQQSEDTPSRWIRHAIDTSWSQPHSILLADIDGDGHAELVAGKRYMGHDGRDPGEYDPLVAYWYDFQREQRVWKRGVISAGGPAGFGLDPKAADLDGDGDVDLVVADRSGLYWFENRPRAESHAVVEAAPRYEDHGELLVYRGPGGAMAEVTTAAHWGVRRAHILAGLQRAMGPLPDSSQRVPLEIRTLGEEETPHYTRRRIEFAADGLDRVPAYLLIPKNLTDPAPAMLCLHQTTRLGKDEPAGLGGRSTLHYAHELAELGYVCIVPDYPSFGEYAYDFQASKSRYVSGSMKAIWNNIRAVDVLDTLSQVDRDRIGCIGHSLGGHNGLFTAVFDQRIRVVISSCGFTAFHHYADGNLAGWTSPRYMPRIRDEFHNDPNRVPFDFHEVLAALAPRSVFINAPLRDGNFPVTGVEQVVDKAAEVYALLAAGDRLAVHHPDCDHAFPDHLRHRAYEWLAQQFAR